MAIEGGTFVKIGRPEIEPKNKQDAQQIKELIFLPFLETLSSSMPLNLHFAESVTDKPCYEQCLTT